MPEWLVEEGIGETRVLLIDDDDVLAAKLRWPGDLVAGRIVEAKLASRTAGSSRGTATTDFGREILLDRLPRDVAEGATVSVRITRDGLAERGRFKRAQGRIAEASEAARVSNPLDEARIVRRFPPGAWEKVWEDAWAGEIAFAGGSLQFSVTPAMLLIDIDGTVPARDLALAAIAPLAAALRRFDLGGSIGIDFPTLASKADRRVVDTALDAALADWPHERTAMNGFGFVQLVARLEGPSLLHRMASARVGAAARMALRRAELCEGTGRVLLLTAHPAVIAKLKPEWLEELAHRTGKEVRTHVDPAIAIGAAHAQMVER